MEHASRYSLSAIGKRLNRARPLLVGAAAVCLLVSVALYNGYPTVFSDTGGYLLTGTTFVAFPPFRAPGYSVFTRLASLETSAWFIILAQALTVVYVLQETCNYLIEGDAKIRDLCLLAGVSILAAFTSLPWLVSLLMPDVFAGVIFLSAFLLVFNDDLLRTRRIALAAILWISVSSHMSFLPIAGLFIPVLLAMKFAARRTQPAPSAKSILGWVLVPVIASGIFTATLNREMGLGFTVSPSRNDFMLANLFGDSLAADYLKQDCPKDRLVSCRDLSRLPQSAEEFLFRHPLYIELRKHPAEIDKIVRGTLSAYPQQFLESSARQTFFQIASLRTADEIRSYGAKDWNNHALQSVFPGEIQDFRKGRQFRDRLLPLADAASKVDTGAFWLSAAACLLLAGISGFSRINMLFYSSILFLAINAAICATFAGVFDRYQSRVAWIMPFCLTAYVLCWVREWKRSGVRDSSTTADYEFEPSLPADLGTYAGPGQVSFTSEVQEES